MMNRTSTHGRHNTTYSIAERLGCDHNRWAPGMVCLWNNWSIQLYVLLCLIFQIVLAVLGSRRKVLCAKPIRFVIWASYSLASYIPALVLSKLTSVSLNKSREEYDTELTALLAPLTLLLLGNPDSITAYSLEDNWLGFRRVLSLVMTFPFVVWILVRSWKTSIRMMLYFPALVAGIIEYGKTIWAIYSAYDENVNMKLADFDEERDRSYALRNFPIDDPDLEIFLKAYHRFDVLQPHLEDRLKHPFVQSHSRLMIDHYSPEDVFLTTEMELGFMYDVLYTKAPVLYTNLGITLRVTSCFSLLLTLGGFTWLFSDKLLRDPYVIYTFGLLIGVVFLGNYQLLKLFCSDWIIIKYMSHRNLFVSKFLKFIVKQSRKKERWANIIGQFNFLDFCQSNEGPRPSGILSGKAEMFRRNSALKSVPAPMYLKELLLDYMKTFESIRELRPFTERGRWTLGKYEFLDKLEWSIEMTFDRSIIIWHLATDVCNSLCPEDSNYKNASKLISNYMMFLLVRHRQIFSLTTVEINYRHAYWNLKKFLKKTPKANVAEDLSGPHPVEESDSFALAITEWWDVLEEVRELARQLQHNEDRWRLISSVWVEMLCFVAYNCQRYHHVKLLRQGGEIITHVWLLLSHKTDQFNTSKYTARNMELG